MLGLEAVQTAVRKIADTAVVEARRFAKGNVRKGKISRGNSVAVPEPAAAAEFFKIAINRIDRCARPSARKNEVFRSVDFLASYGIAVRSVAEAERCNLSGHKERGKNIICAVVSDQNGSLGLLLKRKKFLVCELFALCASDALCKVEKCVCRDFVRGVRIFRKNNCNLHDKILSSGSELQ